MSSTFNRTNFAIIDSLINEKLWNLEQKSQMMAI
jgi:hypothetical protein